MLCLEVGPSSRTYQYRQVSFLCPNCKNKHTYTICDDPNEFAMCTTPAVICDHCCAVLPEVSRIIKSKAMRLLWHKTKDIYFNGSMI